MQILLIDDHTLFREALRNLLEQSFDSSRIIEASSPEEALKFAQLLDDIDIIFLDLDFPESSGLDALPMFREIAPATPIVILSASEKANDIRRAMKTGAAGYIPKTISGPSMLESIQSVLDGEIVLPPSLERILNDKQPVADDQSHLTCRQLEILQLMANGSSNKAIARATGITEGTVKLHVTAVLKALKADNRTEAVVIAARQGLVRTD